MRKWITRKRVLAIAVAAIVLIYVDAKYVEPQWIQVTHYDVPLAGLPKSLDGITIVQISDLHKGVIVRDSVVRKAIRIAGEQHADIVVLTGDLINWPPSGAEPCAKLASRLKPGYGIYAILGNHDYDIDAARITQALSSRGIHVLKNENVEVLPGLRLIGLDDLVKGSPNVQKAWDGVDESEAQVALSHNPESIKLFSHHRCLALCGHTHGGEVRIPFLTRRLLALRFGGLHYLSGWYEVGNTRMYVSRGIGMVNPRGLRFLSRPEIAVFRLRSSE